MLNIGTDGLGYPFPAWSLSVEMWIGILVFWPIFISLRYKQNLNPLIAMLAIGIYAYIYCFCISSPPPFDNHLKSNGMFTMSELRCLAGLLLGYCLYFVYRVNFINAFSKITINITAILLFVVLSLLFSGKLDSRVFLLAMPLFILVLSSNKCLLNHVKGKLIGIFAKMSYSIYLFHHNIWALLFKFNIAYFNTLTKHQQQRFASLTTLLICIPITIYLEPFLIKKTREALLNKFSAKNLSTNC